MYFLRLTKIKPAVEEVASTAWGGTVIGGEEVQRVERVLDVRQGELCWVGGTVYMDMPLKPNILEDVSKDVSIGSHIRFNTDLDIRVYTNHASDGFPPPYPPNKRTSPPMAPIKPCSKTTPAASASLATSYNPSPS